MSLLSILITTHNRLDTLTRCMDAIFASDKMDIVKDIIVVDDGSADSTPKYLQQLLEQDKITDIVRNEQAKGPAVGRNQGINRAKGEYILIMGDDVILFSSTIGLFYNHIQNHGLHNASVIGNILPYPDNMSTFEYWSCNGGSQFAHYRIPDEDKFNAGDEYFYTSNVVTPTAILKEHPFEESFYHARYEDRELAYRLKKKINHKIHYLAEAKSYHRHKFIFKQWLQNFEQFTLAALHFSDLYPEDSDLKLKMGISAALETESFQNDSLENAVQFLNNYHNHFFTPQTSFGQSWIKDVVSISFRTLQEFFRINYYRKHLNVPVLVDSNGRITASEAMSQIIEKLDSTV